MNLEDELRLALRRQDAPAGFAERVIAASGRKPRASAMKWILPLSLAASLLVGLVTWGQVEMKRREQAAGKAASQQLVLALRVAGSSLQKTRATIHRMSELEGGRRDQRL